LGVVGRFGLLENNIIFSISERKVKNNALYKKT
jgi:hypothetical protein